MAEVNSKHVKDPSSQDSVGSAELVVETIDPQELIKKHLVASMDINESIVQTAMDVCNMKKRPLEEEEQSVTIVAKKTKVCGEISCW